MPARVSYPSACRQLLLHLHPHLRPNSTQPNPVLSGTPPQPLRSAIAVSTHLYLCLCLCLCPRRSLHPLTSPLETVWSVAGYLHSGARLWYVLVYLRISTGVVPLAILSDEDAVAVAVAVVVAFGSVDCSSLLGFAVVGVKRITTASGLGGPGYTYT